MDAAVLNKGYTMLASLPKVRKKCPDGFDPVPRSRWFIRHTSSGAEMVTLHGHRVMVVCDGEVTEAIAINVVNAHGSLLRRGRVMIRAVVERGRVTLADVARFNSEPERMAV